METKMKATNTTNSEDRALYHLLVLKLVGTHALQLSHALLQRRLAEAACNTQKFRPGTNGFPKFFEQNFWFSKKSIFVLYF